MSYLLKKLSEVDNFTPEEVKKMLVREGLVDMDLDYKYEAYLFFCEREKYYRRMNSSNPKMSAITETCKAYQISQRLAYYIRGMFD